MAICLSTLAGTIATVCSSSLLQFLLLLFHLAVGVLLDDRDLSCDVVLMCIGDGLSGQY